MGYFVTIDSTTHILLAVIAATLVMGLLLRPGPPLVHPFLLGKQAIPSHSRQQGESAVYLNATTAGTRAPVRPGRDVKTVWDLVRSSAATFGHAKAGTWVNGGESVNEIVMALRAGLVSQLGDEGGKIAVLIEDPTGEFNTARPRHLVDPGVERRANKQINRLLFCQTRSWLRSHSSSQSLPRS